MKQRLFIGGMLFMLFFISNLASAVVEMTVTVTNISDNLDGDTSSIPALISDPGEDGSISFREALYACDGTAGPKQIQFAPELAGSKITLDLNQDEPLYLSSGELTINGDINNDNEPDITLKNGFIGESGYPTGTGLAIISSHNSILGLVLEDFDSAILMACPEPDCSPKNFSDNKIIGNKFSSQRSEHPLIYIGIGGLSWPESFPQMSGVTWRDIQISGNTFIINDSQDAAGAIALVPGGGGASGNLIENVTITHNNIEGGVIAIAALGMDCSSDYFGVPGPTIYSEGNLIKNLTIKKNVITNNVEAICLSTANDGGRYNQILNTKILDNQISRSTIGIAVHGGAWGDSQRSTADNLISKVEIRQNTVSETLSGILVQAGHDAKGKHGLGCEKNNLNNIQISDNIIQNYTYSGIGVYGGFSNDYEASNNTIDTLTVENNQISTIRNGVVGLKLTGGLSEQRIAQGNKLQSVNILQNVISGNDIGIWLIGGEGLQSKANRVVISRILANNVDNNIEGTRITRNYEGASGNVVEITEIENFVNRFYQLCLDRNPDQIGLDGWVAALLNGTQTGSDVAYGFVFSQEFINKNTTNEEYLTVLYEAFFNRQPDSTGLQGWLDAMANGARREDVLKGFIYSTEFTELCEQYGIKAFEGHITKAQREAVEAFVTRFYQFCLDRDPDAAGMEGWTNNLLNQIQTGADVANGFINSPEFINKNTTNGEYVTILYKAFFNRNPDQDGWDAWLAEINSGKDRGYVLNGFLGSQEFLELCEDYGITPN